jgi:hypothetical protein
MALQVFQTARAALEAVRGTDLTPTRIVYGESFTHNHEVATIRPEELRNSYEGFFSAAAGPEKSTLEIGGRVSYDDLIWYGNLFFKAVASGTGAGADKTWTFTPSNTTDDVKTATVQLGYSDTIATAPGVKLNFVMGDELNLHWEKNDDGAATFKANFMTAKALTQITAFTGSLSDRTVTLASANNTTVYVDTATIGTTADPLVTALDFTLNLNPVPFYSLDGTTAAQAIYRPQHRTWKASVTRQYNVGTHFTAFQNKTVQKIRCRTLGPSLGGSNYKIDLDLYGVWTERKWADVDGIITEELTLEPVYDVTTSSSHSLVVVNATASIT